MMNGNKDGINDIQKNVQGSRLTIVFSKETFNWAKPFVQYLWKLTGGVHSKNQIAWIGEIDGEKEPETLRLPGIIHKFAKKENIVSEIKKIFNPFS